MKMLLAMVSLVWLSIPGINASQSQSPSPDGWIELYDDKGFKDRRLTVTLATNMPNLKKRSTDDGKKGFNDKASSVRYDIPDGWAAVLYDDANYKDSTRTLEGRGEISDLGSFSDKCSSVRWEKVAR